jgi:hypothetical protein
MARLQDGAFGNHYLIPRSGRVLCSFRNVVAGRHYNVKKVLLPRNVSIFSIQNLRPKKDNNRVERYDSALPAQGKSVFFDVFATLLFESARW